jgi:adenine nucleotide transporter 17
VIKNKRCFLVLEEMSSISESIGEVFSYIAFVHAVSGAVGGSIAMTTFYPLDWIRTHQQAHPEISITETIRREGIPILYRGLQSTLISLYASNFVYFYSHNLLKVLIKRATQRTLTVWDNLMISTIAGVVNVISTNPFWVANYRIKLQLRRARTEDPREEEYNGFFQCLLKIMREEGIPGLWGGVWASLLLVSNPIIHHVLYDSVVGVLQRRALSKNRKHLTSGEFFAAGAFAKAIATIVTYPIQLAQTRLRSGPGRPVTPRDRTTPGLNPNSTNIQVMQLEDDNHQSPNSVSARPVQFRENIPIRLIDTPSDTPSDTIDNTTPPQIPQENHPPIPQQNRPQNPPHRENILHVLQLVYRTNGFFGLYSGLSAKLLQTVLAAAFHFMNYEAIKRIIFSILSPRQPLIHNVGELNSN